MKISKARIKEIIREELSEGGMMGPYEPERNKATEAMRLLSQLRSMTTEEWSQEAGASFDALLTLLQDIEEDLRK